MRRDVAASTGMPSLMNDENDPLEMVILYAPGWRSLKPIRIVSSAQSIPAEVEVISNYYHADLNVMPEAEMSWIGPRSQASRRSIERQGEDGNCRLPC